jgi:hypothetical protein
MKAITTFENLHKIERELRTMFYNSRASYRFMETRRASALSDKWDYIMTTLRGYGVHKPYGAEMNQSWVDHCNAEGFAPDYNIEDVLC